MGSEVVTAPFGLLAWAVPPAPPSATTLAQVLAGLLGAAFAALLVGVRGQLGTLASSPLFRRWCTWAVVGPLLGGALLLGPLPFALLMAAVAAQGAREYGRLVDLGPVDAAVLAVGCAVVPVAATRGERWAMAAVVAATLVATLPVVLGGDAVGAPRRLGTIGFGLLYLGLSAGLLVRLDAGAARGPLVAVALAVALSDVGAFCLGRLFGRRALAPRLSPSKTWAGAVGNVVGATFGLALLRQWLPSDAALAPLALLVAAGALWGDLLESALKRAAGVKDSGGALPGFGGVLDRVDSLLVVGPLVWLAAAVAS